MSSGSPSHPPEDEDDSQQNANSVPTVPSPPEEQQQPQQPALRRNNAALQLVENFADESLHSVRLDIESGFYSDDLLTLLLRDSSLVRPLVGRYEETSEPMHVKCPQCQVSQAYQPTESCSGEVSTRYSHNARVLHQKATCPICLDIVEPPMVVLACGHTICPEHFQCLNGKIGYDAMLSIQETLDRQRRGQASLANERQNQNAERGVREWQERAQERREQRTREWRQEQQPIPSNNNIVDNDADDDDGDSMPDLLSRSSLDDDDYDFDTIY